MRKYIKVQVVYSLLTHDGLFASVFHWRFISVSFYDTFSCIDLSPFSPEIQTIGWLAKEASDRYYKMYHMRPTVSIATEDGAALSPDDLVVEMFCNNDEVCFYELYTKSVHNQSINIVTDSVYKWPDVDFIYTDFVSGICQPRAN